MLRAWAMGLSSLFLVGTGLLAACGDDGDGQGGSGPGGSTRSLSIYVYEAFFRQGEIGPAVAASVLLFIASFAVLFTINQGLARRAK